VTKATKSIISWAPKERPRAARIAFSRQTKPARPLLKSTRNIRRRSSRRQTLPTAIYDWEVGICPLGSEEIWRRLDEMQSVTAPRKNGGAL
jgi:hypothetical protein